MIYNLIMLAPVATPYGIAFDRWEFPRVTQAELTDVTRITEGLGWATIVTVSLTKDQPLPLTEEEHYLEFYIPEGG